MKYELWSIIALTLKVSGTATLLSAVIGIPIGIWLGLSGFQGKGLIKALVHTGMALPPVIVGLVIYILLSQSGPMAFLESLFTPQAMIAAQFVLALPFVVGISANAVESIPPDLEPQIRSLGASEWQCRLAVLREAREGVLLAIAAAFGRSISEVGAVLIVGGNIRGYTRVLTTAIVLETGKGDFRFALALGAVLLALALAVNVITLRIGINRLPS